MIKAIIFDYDGVIVDSFSSVFEVYKKICERFRISSPQTIESFRKTYGYNYTECLTNLGIPKKDSPIVQNIFLQEIVKFDHEIFPGIYEVIERLSKKYQLFLVSTSHSHEVLTKIKKFGLDVYFKEIHCGADNKIKKSVMILELLERHKYSPEEVISIGDRVIDLKSFNQAGISDSNIILVTYGWGLNKGETGQAKIANTPNDILNLIT